MLLNRETTIHTKLVPEGDFFGIAKYKADSMLKNEAVIRRAIMHELY